MRKKQLLKWINNISPYVALFVGASFAWLFNSLPQWIAKHPKWFGEGGMFEWLTNIAPTWYFYIPLGIVIIGSVVLMVNAWNQAGKQVEQEEKTREYYEGLEGRMREHELKMLTVIMKAKGLPNAEEAAREYQENENKEANQTNDNKETIS